MKTLTVDAYKRVRLPDAEPGQVFAYENHGQGKRVLTEVSPVGEPRPAKVRIEKRGAYHVGVLDRPINQAALEDALAEFP